MHEMEPAKAAKVPARQFAHTDVPDETSNIPATQFEHAVDFDGEYMPAAQLVHVEGDGAATSTEYVPAGQLVQLVAPAVA